jgi:hypothetical protein
MALDLLGFTRDQEDQLRGLLARFRASGLPVGALRAIEFADMPGYEGRVFVREEDGEVQMVLSTCAPFTVAHELAHVADIALRWDETLEHLGCGRSVQWHLAHRMTSEYYANRTACRFVPRTETLHPLAADIAGLIDAAHQRNWSAFLIHHALVTGILHGMGRESIPLAELGLDDSMPSGVLRAFDDFPQQARAFFETQWDAIAA